MRLARLKGELVSGAHMDPWPNYATRVTARYLKHQAEALTEFMPCLRGLRFMRIWSGLADMTPDMALLRDIVRIYEKNFDEQFGGFGSGQKFPNPVALDFLLDRYAETKDEGLRKIIIKTLDSMAAGGLRDQEEGGFFRYATKQDWSEPHYEKMLEVNAGLLGNYARAYAILPVSERR